ncbi:MAG: hypothetical protein RIR65_213 [Planctomycetota bacterium]
MTTAAEPQCPPADGMHCAHSPWIAAARRALLVVQVFLLAVPSACDRRVEAHWDSGVLRSRGAVDGLDGEREGEWIFHYPNGERREGGRYEDGRRVGVWVQWYPNGQLRSRGERRPSPEGPSWREGPWTYWHENGIVAARGIHRNGLREGQWEMSIDTGGLDGLGSGLYHAGERIDAPSTAPGDDDSTASLDLESQGADLDRQDGR